MRFRLRTLLLIVIFVIVPLCIFAAIGSYVSSDVYDTMQIVTDQRVP